MKKPRSLALLAISRVKATQLPFCETAAGTMGASALIVEHTYTGANLPSVGVATCADADDDAGWLVGWDYGQFCAELAIEDLEV